MKIIIAGDFVPNGRLRSSIEQNKFEEIFDPGIPEIIRSADFSFVNLEAPIIIDSCKPIRKCGPNLEVPNKTIEAIKYLGFTGVTLANNHILDFGEQGLNNTIQRCFDAGLDVVGAGSNVSNASSTLVLKCGERKLAVINCCEHEFSIAASTTAGANPLNPIQQFYAIREARKLADKVIVIVHGGHECYQLPSPRMKEIYRFFVDAGADAVINHHQHCYSGYEFCEGKSIFYGLGNFCFDKVSQSLPSSWNYGYMVELLLDDEITFKLHPYHQCGAKPEVKLLSCDAFNDELQKLNDIIGDDKKLQGATEAYYKTCTSSEISTMEPYVGRVLGKLYQLHLLPSFVQGRRIPVLLNHIECESHRDKLVYALK